MDLPPLPAIRAFEAVARHLSFTRAAESLSMTQAAVSYQIKMLEDRLGTPLFLRQPRGVALTETGARLATPTAQAFETLRLAFAEAARQAERLTISTTASFAGNWLAQRIGRFQADYPNLTLRIDMNDRLTDFAREDIDVAIRKGKGDWPGLSAWPLLPFEVTPIASPDFLARHAALTDPAQIVALHWINPGDPYWPVWLQQAGVIAPDCPPRQAVTMPSQLQEARAAMAGEGIALLTPRFFRFELATGALIQPFPLVTKGPDTYWLTCPESRRNRPAIKAFRRFLTAEIQAESASSFV
ncbi:MAG: LysR substrate-binding domain-containing protein [Paracoccus sp. (in: a-proteobacteria)]|uniref:LysR substrate-binding domain-containing protein n=1 Tax=Paracoccus sp. TaxID=267 RepID=UPI0026E0B366|nr:LysR substrate-binding domain-containing protein [Paracoccus sp. (in: a-proteobacteria)]MDO5620768.1 LysR substrate-binding domain-containing protein [Paracoccus sp. (in: a-proteobacteria)]